MLRLALLATTLIAADSASLGEGGREGGREEARPWNWHGHLYCRIVCAAYCYHVYEAVWEWYIGEGCFS